MTIQNQVQTAKDIISLLSQALELAINNIREWPALGGTLEVQACYSKLEEAVCRSHAVPDSDFIPEPAAYHDNHVFHLQDGTVCGVHMVCIYGRFGKEQEVRGIYVPCRLFMSALNLLPEKQRHELDEYLRKTYSTRYLMLT